jgi:hypothetical protein
MAKSSARKPKCSRFFDGDGGDGDVQLTIDRMGNVAVAMPPTVTLQAH